MFGSNNTYSKQDGKSKVGAISKAQKAQSFQTCKNGDPSGFLKIQFVAEYQIAKYQRRPFGNKKCRNFILIFEKKQKEF